MPFTLKANIRHEDLFGKCIRTGPSSVYVAQNQSDDLLMIEIRILSQIFQHIREEPPLSRHQIRCIQSDAVTGDTNSIPHIDQGVFIHIRSRPAVAFK